MGRTKTSVVAGLEDKVMTTSEAAKRLGFTRDMVFRLARDGELEAAKIGRDFIIDRESVERYREEKNQWKAEILERKLVRYGPKR